MLNALLNAFVPAAHAQTAATPAGGDMLMSFLPLILVLAVFYMLVLRPQNQRAKQHAHMLTTLRRGDKVLTTGGFQVWIQKVEEGLLKVSFTENGDSVTLATSSVVAVLEQANAKKDAKADKKADKKSSK